MSDPIRQLCAILLDKAQPNTGDDLSSIASEVLRELDQNEELTQSLRQDSRMLQINMGQSKGYQVLVETNATAYIGDQYHFNSDAVIEALGKLLDEFAKKQPIVGTPNNLPRSGAIAFVGRNDLLSKLRDQLQGNEPIAITSKSRLTSVKGMGGIGKTELALQYAIASYNENIYPGGVCWLHARDREITTQIVSFAKANLGIKPPDDLEAGEQVRFTWQRWPQGDSLIILDDVTDFEAIAPYLPPSDPRFKVLITTRLNLGSSVTQIEIEELTDESAIALLKSITGDEQIESQLADAEKLCDWVGNLPLGLELLGRFLARKPDWAIAKLLERLESKRLAAKALVEGESGMTATLGIAAALELSWTELDEQEQDLACLLGMFAVAPIPWDLVEQCFEDIDPDDLEDWRDEGLGDRSLIKRVDEGTYQLHQIVQEFFREKLRAKGEGGRSQKEAFGQVMVLIAKAIDERPTLDQIRKAQGMIAHLEAMINNWLESLPDDDKIWPFIGIGRFYAGQGNYGLAKPWYQKCLSSLKNLLGSDHPSVATSINNLAALYDHQGRYDNSELLYLQALELMKRLLGSNHPDVATSINNLAALYDHQGRYDESEPLYLQALELRKKLLGNDHPDVASSINNLAGTYKAQGRYDEAEPLYLQALKLSQKLLGPDHPDVASSINNIAALYNEQGRYDEVEPLYLQALDLREKILGPNHPDVAASINNLAALYYNLGRYDEAEILYQKALKLWEELLGPNHPSVATSINNLAALYYNLGRYKEAEILYQKALRLWKELLGPNHPSVATTINNLAEIHKSQGRYDKAEPLYLQALDLRKKILGPDHSDVASSINSLATLYSNIERFSEAEALYLQALELWKKILGPDHPDVASGINNLALLYYNQGKHDKAETLYLKALELRKNLLGNNHPDVAGSYLNLGALYHQQKKYRKAKSVYLIAQKIYNQQLGQIHPNSQVLLSWFNALPEGTESIPLEDLGL